MKKAFTLAEVLITLGIIGVISAMVLPTLITNYQKRLTVTKLKKVYSQLNQVMKLIDEEQGLAVLSGMPKNFVPKYIFPHYNNATLYYPNDSLSNVMCYNPNHYYHSATTGPVQYSWGKTGVGISTPFSPYTSSIELPDGTCIGFANLIPQADYPYATIFVDINGSANKPNRAGKDLFFFYLDLETNSVQPSEKTMGGIDWSNYGASKIIKDGWQITKDYIW